MTYDNNDIRDQMGALDDIRDMAIFLVLLDYERPAIKATLVENFPGQDADAAIELAEAHKIECERQLAEQFRSDDAAARRAEHDLSTTMHEEG